MGKSVQIDALGTNFAIQTDESPEYVETLVGYVTGKFDDLKKTLSSKDPLKLAILTCILIADELHKQRETGGSGDAVPEERMQAMTKNMIASIDAVLQDGS